MVHLQCAVINHDKSDFLQIVQINNIRVFLFLPTIVKKAEIKLDRKIASARLLIILRLIINKVVFVETSNTTELI